MSDATPDQPLHLPSLVIKNFRGIDELTIPRLGRVTLLAGKNGVGKTTVLDAVRIYAARGRYGDLSDVLQSHEEFYVTKDEEGDEVLAPDWSSLFYGRRISSDAKITIGPPDIDQQLTIEADMDDGAHLRSAFQGEHEEIPIGYPWDTVRKRVWRGMIPEFPIGIVCESLGPSLPGDVDLARLWDKVALTDDEARAVEALNLALDVMVERIAVIGSAGLSGLVYGRRVFAKVSGIVSPVPLRSLGDGATRLFGVGLALANGRGGLLVIDEAENGIHHTVQAKFWKMVLQTAQRNNVQVLATTHSWDCVKGFAQAANELEDEEGLLVRIERVPAGLRAVEYSERNLQAAAKYGIEVR